MTGFGKDGKGVILYETNEVSLGTLAKDTVLSMGNYGIEEDFRMLRSEVFVIHRDPTAGEGPLLFGLARGDLTVTEIKETLETEPTDPQDTKLEKSHRPVWPLGFIGQGHGGTVTDPSAEFVWDKRWTFMSKSSNDGWQFWVYNMDLAALTTGSKIRYIAKHFGVWVV